MKYLLLLLALSGCYVNPFDGAACEENDDCNSGLCVRQYEDGKPLPGGICTHDCWETGSCVKDEYQTCVRYTVTNEQYCFMLCEDDSWCREGWYCGPNTHACIPDDR